VNRGDLVTVRRNGETHPAHPPLLALVPTTTSRRLGSNYWRLWSASVVSNFGDGVALIAYPWLASAVTRSPVQIALVGVASRLPWLFFTLPAGVITDRADRRRLVVTMDVIRGLITVGVAAVVLMHQGSLPTPEQIEAGIFPSVANSGLLLGTLYLSALLLGMAEVLRDNGAQTLMPAVVEKAQLEKANGRLWGAEMVMNSFVGPPLGGFLLAFAFSLPFFVDSVTFVVSAALLATLKGVFQPAEATRTSFGSDLAEGFRWLWRHQLLRRFAVVLGLINGSSAATFATLVLFGQEVLAVDARGFGLLMSAGAAGGVLGSLAAAPFTKRLGSGATIMFTLVSSAITTAIIGVTSSAIVVWVMFAASSFGAVMWNVVTVSLRQAIIPDRLLGRVNSVYRFFGWGMMPVGIFLGGVLVDLFARIFDREIGLRSPFLLAALLQVGLAIYALGRLGTRQIEDARAEAEASSG